MRIVPTQTLVRAIPVLDEKGKPIQVKKIYDGVERLITATENAYSPPDVPIDVSDKEGRELIGKGLARLPDPTLDDSEV